jgi:hypothetical protein
VNFAASFICSSPSGAASTILTARWIAYTKYECMTRGDGGINTCAGARACAERTRQALTFRKKHRRVLDAASSAPSAGATDGAAPAPPEDAAGTGGGVGRWRERSDARGGGLRVGRRPPPRQGRHAMEDGLCARGLAAGARRRSGEEEISLSMAQRGRI